MIHVGQLDGRVAGRIDQLARWWTQASNEARFALLKRTCTDKTAQDPTLAELHLAIIAAEVAAGEAREG